MRDSFDFSWFAVHRQILKGGQAAFDFIGANAFERASQDECGGSCRFVVQFAIAQFGIDGGKFAPNSSRTGQAKAPDLWHGGRCEWNQFANKSLREFFRSSSARFLHGDVAGLVSRDAHKGESREGQHSSGIKPHPLEHAGGESPALTGRP